MPESLWILNCLNHNHYCNVVQCSRLNRLFQKTSKQRQGWGKTPELLRFTTLPLEIPDKIKLHSWKFHKIVLHPLEFLRSETKTNGNLAWYFLLPLQIPFPYFFNPGIFTFFCFSISLEIPCFCPPLIWIFLGTVQFLSKDLQCSHNWKMHLSFTNSSHTSAWSDHYCSHLEEPPHKFFTQKPSPMKSIFFWKKSCHTLGGSTIYTDYLVTLVHNSNK